MFASLRRETGIFAFGVGGNVLLTHVALIGLLVGEPVVLIFNGLGLNGERGSGEKFEVFMFKGSGGWGFDAAFALYVVDGRGRVGISSCDGSGACDNRRPICTVAEDAIDESLRWFVRDPGPKIGGGGVRSLMS